MYGSKKEAKALYSVTDTGSEPGLKIPMRVWEQKNIFLCKRKKSRYCAPVEENASSSSLENNHLLQSSCRENDDNVTQETSVDTRDLRTTMHWRRNHTEETDRLKNQPRRANRCVLHGSAYGYNVNIGSNCRSQRFSLNSNGLTDIRTHGHTDGQTLLQRCEDES